MASPFRPQALENDGTTPAPEGQIYVCAACGKRSRTRYGFDDNNQNVGPSHGWDESCMLNAVLCYEQRDLLTAEWVAVDPPKLIGVDNV